jgi:probable phosphomutase (TIGR03848 family)
VTIFALIRHAKHNLVGRTIVGRASGVRLSAEGKAQAERLARRLAGSSIAAVYSSPLERALETAAAIATPLNLEVEVAEELNEIEYGAWTGRQISDLRELAEWRRFNQFRGSSEIPGGETMLEVQGRMLRFIERLCVAHSEQTVAVVSHGDVIKASLAHYLGVPLDLFHRIEISPASVSLLRVERYGPEVLLLNGFVEDGLL